MAGNSMHVFREGEIYLLGANMPHLFKSDPTYFITDSDKEVHTVTIFFDPSGKLAALFSLPEMKTVKAFMEQSQTGFKISDSNYTDTAKRIEKIQSASGAQQLSLFIELLNIISTDTGLIPLSSASYTYSMTDPQGMRIATVYNYIMNNYKTPLKLEEVAAQAHLTPTAFCRYFKKHTRHTFVNFLNNIRVSEACKMLVSNESVSIASIAYGCGFNSITNFNYVFKSITGKSPRDYVNDYSQTLR